MKWGYGPGHWQGMVRKVIVIIMVFMIVIGNMDNTVIRGIMGITVIIVLRQTDKQTDS